MKPTPNYALYLCTDRDLMSSATVEESVAQAVKGGATVVQLREKACSSLEFYELARRVHEITLRAKVPLIINDRVDIALAVDAEGVHVGQSDLPAAKVRELLGPEKLIGVSAGTAEEAIAAERAGADYLGVGAMFSTSTKPDADVVSPSELAKIRAAVKIPFVLIGGMNAKTIPSFKGFGMAGFAVISAIVAANDVARAASEIRHLAEEALK